MLMSASVLWHWKIMRYIYFFIKGLTGDLETEDLETVEAFFIPGCQSDFGCCADGVTPAQGPEGPKHKDCPGNRIQIYFIFVIVFSTWFVKERNRKGKDFIYSHSSMLQVG